MVDAVLELLPHARVGHIGLQRDEQTALASRYYARLPAHMASSTALIVDPMLATGGSALAAIDLIQQAGDARYPAALHRRGAGGHRRRGSRSTPRCPSTPPPSIASSTRASSSCPDLGISETVCMAPRKPRSTGSGPAAWTTDLTSISPNRILVRGYRLDDLMGRVSFSDTIYLLLTGDLPSPTVARLVDVMLVSFIDHGATPPSTLAALNTTTTGASIRGAVAAGVLGFGRYHGGDALACRSLLDEGLAIARGGPSMAAAAKTLVDRLVAANDIPPPGFGHRFHTVDPRATRLLQLALELEADHAYTQLLRALEHALVAPRGAERPAAAGEYRWRDCRGLRRPRLAHGSRRRAAPDFTRAGPGRARPRRTAARIADAGDRPDPAYLRRTAGTEAPGGSEVTGELGNWGTGERGNGRTGERENWGTGELEN